MKMLSLLYLHKYVLSIVFGIKFIAKFDKTYKSRFAIIIYKNNKYLLNTRILLFIYFFRFTAIIPPKIPKIIETNIINIEVIFKPKLPLNILEIKYIVII